MNGPLYFWLLLRASLLSTGGMGNVPMLHDDFLARGMATETQIVESIAVGQIAPGPTGLWVISLGYLMHGLPGALLALLAITIPPLFILAIEGLYRRVQQHPIVDGFVHGLGLAVIGVFFSVLVRMLHAGVRDLSGVLIVFASIALTASRRVPVPAVLLLAGLAGLLIYRPH